MIKIRAVFFDMIGTTVLEKDPTVISSCFENAFAQHGVMIDSSQIRQVRGKDKIDAIKQILTSSNYPRELQPRIFESFKSNVAKNVSNFEGHPELDEVIRQLKKRDLKIGIGSGLPVFLFQMLVEKFKWQKYSFDYMNVYENFAEGRPNPAMIFDLCEKFKIDPAQVLKVGDTVADIEEGKNAGSLTAAVMVGTQTDETLQEAKPDFILRSLGEIIKIVT